MPSTSNPHTHEVEVDTEIAAAYKALVQAVHALDSAKTGLRFDIGDRRTGYGAGPWGKSWDETVAIASERSATDFRVRASLLRVEEAQAAWRGAVCTYESAEARYGGWSRFFLVTNTNGHIHSSMNCSTCYPTTEYAWLPHLSGLSEAEAVADQGEILCSVCFPSAPAEWTNGQSNASKAEKAARAAEKAAKQAAKDAKAITAPDGSPLRIHWYGSSFDTIKTKIAARNALSQAVQDFGFYGAGCKDGHVVDNIKILSEALAADGTFDPAKVIETAAKKALKEGADHDYRKVAR